MPRAACHGCRVAAQQNTTVEPLVDGLWFSTKKPILMFVLVEVGKKHNHYAFADLSVCRQDLTFGAGLLTSVFTQITVTTPNSEQSFDPS